MPVLVAPTTRLHAAWLDARDDWGPGTHEDGFGLGPTDEVDSPAGFAAWVAGLLDEERPTDDGRQRCSFRWVVEDDRVLGGIALRHRQTEYVDRFGHIGYGIRPSARGRGIGTWALGEILGTAREIGLERVLLVCALDNVASARTIERNGGVLDDIRENGELGTVRRYWITIP